jgi:DNA adenine methylase
MAKPIVKWAGGKSKLLGELLSRVPAHVHTYAEPFAGGAALFFALASDRERSFDHAILADQNEELVACYRAVKSDVGSLIEALKGLPPRPRHLLRGPRRDPAGKSDVERGARLIY